jgi:hypothetical protein
MKNIEKILNFNGKEISLVLAEGQWWIALKPICEALGINYERQRQNIQEDEILSQLPTEQQVVAADNALRKMVCLPEKFVYGWLFGLRSESEDLKKFKLECYNVLWSHFHGRFSALIERVQIDERLAELETKLVGNEAYDEIKDLVDRRKKIAPALRKMDLDLLKGQIRLDI